MGRSSPGKSGPLDQDAGHEGRPGEQPGNPREGQELEDLVELAEEEQDQQVSPPQFSPHPGRPGSGKTPEDQKSRETPQNCQSTEDGKGVLAGGEEGGDNWSEVHHEGPRTGEVEENGQTAGSSRGAQEETPAQEDPQAPNQPPLKKL